MHGNFWINFETVYHTVQVGKRGLNKEGRITQLDTGERDDTVKTL